MPSLIHKMSKMSWNIYYKYVANAPQNETFISQFPRGEHPGPFLFLPPLVVASFPPPNPIPNLALWSSPTGNSYSLHTLPQLWQNGGGGECWKAITYIPSVFFCLFVFLIIILDFVFINHQQFASNPWVYWG